GLLADGLWRGERSYGDQEDSYRGDDRDEHVHVRRQMQEAVPQAEGDAVEAEVRGGVVAQELGVAEDESGAMVVVGVPGHERRDGEEHRSQPAQGLAPA